jgi:hypothetical protein
MAQRTAQNARRIPDDAVGAIRPIPPTPALPRLPMGHLDRLLTEIGLWQHCAGDRPDRCHGYSIDDEARGLIVGLR